MTRKIKELSGGSLALGSLPEGCSLCVEGKKMVLFVTGLCDSTCYYCPLSESKRGKDVVFADEVPVEVDDDILQEVKDIGGAGAGISGGDPIMVFDRTLHYISMLKQRYGRAFHIHMYTSRNDLGVRQLERLKDAGLDEIRFHPQTSSLSGLVNALDVGLDAGVEVPVIPGKGSYLQQIILQLEELGAHFINLNELEVSETNFQNLSNLGMRLVGMDSSVIKGSFETAQSILEWAQDATSSVKVHFCSARYKDAVQMTKRLERRRERVIRSFEVEDADDPLLIVGIIRAQHRDTLSEHELEDIIKLLGEYEIPENLYNFDRQRMRIEIAPWVLEEIVEEIRLDFPVAARLEMGIAYEYPSYDRLQTLFDPL